MLVVNVASKCGHTKQYEALQALYEKHKDAGLIILGFPSNDFKQESGSAEKIIEFCKGKYNVTFPLLEKVHVMGKDEHPVYTFLKSNSKQGNQNVKWNFEKFIVNKKGEVVERYISKIKPDAFEENLAKYLAE